MKRNIIKIEIGEKINKLTLLEILEKKPKQRPTGKFSCECGGEKTATLKDVKYGNVTSCGCLSKPVQIGEKHNKLTLMEIVKDHNKKWQTVGKFTCECGGNITTLLGSVRSGRTKSCGCIKGLPFGEAAFNGLFSSYRFQAVKLRNLSFNLTKNEFRKLTSGNCYFCGIEPSRKYKHSSESNGYYIYNGVDRLDNSIGYELFNCASCCTECNRSKRTLTKEQFISLAYRIYHHQEQLKLKE